MIDLHCTNLKYKIYIASTMYIIHTWTQNAHHDEEEEEEYHRDQWYKEL